jgi:hypothetical protein
MAWSQEQIRRIQQYRRLAGLEDGAYRDLLERVTKCHARSSKDPSLLAKSDFDAVIIELETRWEYRVQEGFVEAPKKLSLRYYRDKILPRDTGLTTEEQVRKVYATWDELKIYLDPQKRTVGYLYGIARNSLRTNVSNIRELDSAQLVYLIEALRDKLKWAKKRDSRMHPTPADPAEAAIQHELDGDHEAAPDPQAPAPVEADLSDIPF